MFDLGWTELLVIGIVALIVVGPKDLPVMFRTVGRFVGRMKSMSREFSTAMNKAADDAGVSDLKKGLDVARSPMNTAMNSVKDAAKGLTDLDAEPSAMTEERREAARKIEAASARSAAERMARQAEDARRKAEALEAELAAPKTAQPGD